MSYLRLFILTLIVCMPPELNATTYWEEAIPDGMTDSEIGNIPASPVTTSPNTKAMFIYVVFPGEEPASDFPNQAVSDSVSIGLVNHLFNSSGGMVDLSPLTVTNPDHQYGWWVAEHSSVTYNNAITVDGIKQYQTHWAGSYPYLGELQAEILHKIYNAYDANGLGNPFTDVSIVEFVYYGDAVEVGGSGVQGYGRNAVNPATFSFLSVMSSDFMSVFPGLLPGVQQESHQVSTWDLRWIISHETGHYFRLWHSPDGNCSLGYILDPTAYYYGPYSNMSLVRITGKGPIPFHPVDLENLGWVDQTEVTTSQRGYVLGDIRLSKHVLKVPIPGSGSQYFLLSYHGGNGMDINLGEDGNPIYPSQGLAIWHIAGGQWDLESAWGRFDDPAMPADGPGFWSVMNAESGYDNLDVWVDLCGIPHGEHPEFAPLYDYFYNYPGSEKDFFGAVSGEVEFSFRTNPSSLGQTGYTRRSPQDILNSMVIRVIQENGDSIVLDILLAPHENVTFPNGGEALVVGTEYNITWDRTYTVDQVDGIINTVDIYFNPGGGQPEMPIAFGAPADLGSYSWTPDSEHVSDSAKIRIVYHNINDSSHTGTDESDDYFVVVAPPVAKFTDVSAGTSLNYSGQPTCAIGYDSDSDVFKDLFVGIEPGPWLSRAYQQTLVGTGGVPEFAPLTLFGPQAGARAVVTGDYDNDGDMDLLVTAVGGAKVYRKDGQNYTEVSSLGLESLTDKATAAVWGDYDNDGWLDLYVVRTGGYTDPPTFPNVFGEQHRLFHNEIALGNGFVDVTAAAGLSGAAIGSVSASFIDFDRDGDLDLFVANLQEPPTGPGGIHSLLYVNQGNGTFAEEYEARFSGESYYATAHKWSDVDNDGDFDLVMTTHESKPEIHFNDGFGGFAFDPVKRLDAAEGHAGLEVFDQDLDGWSDVFCVSKDVANSNRFYSSVETTSGIEFVETTASVGMSIVSQALGSAATDFTRDGDPDLFLGKPTASGEYFYKTDSQTGGQWIGRDYVKLRLESLYAANNRAGLGAIVEVTDGTNVWIRSVDGGSGRGGQDDRDLVFGLGENAGATTATVRWPNGQVQSGISLTKSNETLGETLNLIADDSPVFVNVSATSVINPVTGKLDWTFYWESHLPGDSSQDVVTFDQVGYPTPCWPGWPNLTPSTPGVVPDYGQLPNGKYFHKLVVSNVDCIRGCGFRFTVSSDVSGTLLTSASKSVTVKFCPAQF